MRAISASGLQIAKALGELAQEPELGPRAPELVSLGLALVEDAQAAGDWVEMDLLATFARPDAILPASRHPRLGLVLSVATSGLVFVPVLLTWFGLASAVAAYGRMLDSAAGRAAAGGRTFLDLWQSGFHGELNPLLDLSHVAGYTLTALGLLLLANLVGTWLAHADERAAGRRRAELLSRLVPVLTRAQMLLNRRRLASPARFAAELSRAAAVLGGIFDQAALVQESMAGLSGRNIVVSERLHAAIGELGTTVTRLRDTGAEVAGATSSMRKAATTLAEEVTERAARAAVRLDAAADSAASGLKESREAGERLLAAVTERIDATLTGLGDRITGATDDLARAGSGFAEAIRASAGEAARDVGQTYQEAVAAAAVTLTEKMAGIGEELTRVVADVNVSVTRQIMAAEAAEAARDRHAAVLEQAVTALCAGEHAGDGQDKGRREWP